MQYQFDLHYHSNYSDGFSSIKKIENKCLKNNAGLALTDHNEIRGSIKLLERGNIPIILGMEVGSIEGLDFLIYFSDIDEYIYFYKSQVEPFKYQRLVAPLKNSAYYFLEAAKSLNTFVSLAHPYGFGKKSVVHQEKKNRNEFLEFVYKTVDAIEIFNGKHSRKKNLLALKLQEDLDKKFTVGSDGHDLKSLFDVSVSFDLENINDNEEAFNKLKNNDYEEIETTHKLRLLKTMSIISTKSTSLFLTKGLLKGKRFKTKL